MLEQGRSFSGRERNCCFLNLPDGRFATVSAVTGLDFQDDGRAIAVTDWDQDGDLDLWISNRNAPRLRLMRNQSPGNHHFLTLQLQGDGRQSSRDAIGARVEVISSELGDKKLIRTLRAGEGFLAQSSKFLHIGLGQVGQIEKLRVHWPGGSVQEFEDIQVDKRYRIVQGESEASLSKSAQRKLNLAESPQPPQPSSDTIRVPLVVPLPMPRKISYVDFQDKMHDLAFEESDETTLIVLWASWCLPCWEELKELVERRTELQDAGIKVVALAVDGLGDDRSDPQAAAKSCEKLGVPFPTGMADAAFVQLMTGYHQMLVAMKRQLPVPASFLVDKQGRLAVIYKGRLNVDELVSDAQRSKLTLKDRWKQATTFSGRTIDHESLYDSLSRSEANTLCAMGNALAKGNRFEDAMPFFQAALQVEPTFDLARQGYAQILHLTGRFDEAVREYKQGIAQQPDRSFYHFQLANIYAYQEKWKDAVASFDNAIKCDPNYWQAYAGRANAFVKLNQTESAVLDLKKALQINPRFDAAGQMLLDLQRRRQ